MTTDEIVPVGHGWWVVDSSTGKRTAGPYLKRDQAECELMWREHDFDLRHEQDHATSDTHDRWQMNESRMWDG